MVDDRGRRDDAVEVFGQAIQLARGADKTRYQFELESLYKRIENPNGIIQNENLERLEEGIDAR